MKTHARFWGIILLILSNVQLSQAQWLMINRSGGHPDSSAALEVQTTKHGVLIPRLTQTQRDAIPNPAQGLLLYQTDQDTGFYYFRGNSWLSIAEGLDNDSDSTNELQTLSLAGDTLSISNGNSVLLPSSSNGVYAKDTFYLPNGYTGGAVTLNHSLGRVPCEIYRKNGSSFELLTINTGSLETITPVSEIFYYNTGSGGSSASLTFIGVTAVTDTTITLYVVPSCTNISGGVTGCYSSGLANWTSSEIIAVLYLK